MHGVVNQNARDCQRVAETAFTGWLSEASRAPSQRLRGARRLLFCERPVNKVPGFSPYPGGDFLFRSADSCRMRLLHGVQGPLRNKKILERAMGFEPTTPTLARLCSTSQPGPAASAFEGKTGREAA